MESVIPCEPNGSRDSLLSPTDSQQAVDYRDFCYKYLVTRELYGYIRNSYVASVIRIGHRKVKDIEVFVQDVIECFVAVFYVRLRNVPFEPVE